MKYCTGILSASTIVQMLFSQRKSNIKVYVQMSLKFPASGTHLVFKGNCISYYYLVQHTAVASRVESKKTLFTL